VQLEIRTPVFRPSACSSIVCKNILAVAAIVLVRRMVVTACRCRLFW